MIGKDGSEQFDELICVRFILVPGPRNLARKKTLDRKEHKQMPGSDVAGMKEYHVIAGQKKPACDKQKKKRQGSQHNEKYFFKCVDSSLFFLSIQSM
jgi:hypothetical protein